MHRIVKPGFWLGAYLVLVCTPLLVLVLTPTPAMGGFWWEAGIGLGFAGLIMLAMQFLLTARLRRPTTPFGIDVIYCFHRYLGWVLLLFIMGHPVLLMIDEPALWARLNPMSASWSMLSGMLALLAVLVLMISSVWRRQLRIPYNHWRRLHLLLAVAAVGLGFAHMWAISYYSATAAVGVLWSLMGLSVLLFLLKVRVIRPWRLARRPWRVSHVVPEQGDAWTLTLEPLGHSGLVFEPGQFAWLSLGHSPFIMEEHPFSMAGAPGGDGKLKFTIKELGDFTRRIGRIEPGTGACVDGPYGVFSCEHYPEALGYVFIAGGIGVAPIISMLETLAARGDQRPMFLFAAHSRWDRIPRRDEIAGMAERLRLTSVPVLEDPPGDWNGEKGWITRDMLARYLPEDRARYEYFICGPRPMTRAIERFLRELGVPVSRVHTELFDMA